MQGDQGQRFAVLPPEQPGHVVTERWYLPPPAPLQCSGCGWGQLLGSAVRQADIRGSRRMEVTVTPAAEGGRRWCRQGEGAARRRGHRPCSPSTRLPHSQQQHFVVFMQTSAFPSFCPCPWGAKIQLSFPCWALLGQLSTTIHQVLDTHVVKVCSQGRRWHGMSTWSLCQRS